MGELEEGKSRIEAKEKASQDAASLREIEREQNKRDFESLFPELEKVEREFWNSHIPMRLIDIFRELRTAIEEREGIQMTEKVKYHYEGDFPQHIVLRDTSGIRQDQFPHEFLRENVVELWKDGKLKQIPLRSASLTYSHSDREGHLETVNKVSFKVTHDNELHWSVGYGKQRYLLPGEGARYADRQGSTGTSDAHLDKLVELIIPILENRAYIQTSDHSPSPRDDGDHGIY